MLSPTSNPALVALDAESFAPPTGLPNLLGAGLGELEAFAERAGQPSYRAKQILGGLFARRATTFGALTDLPKDFRRSLEAAFAISRPQIDTVQVSRDGTRKYAFVGVDGARFEAVYIPEVARRRKTNTLCVSSQTGCAVGCKFCFTASLRRNRNLATSEIIGQVLAVQDDVLTLGDEARVSNIVFMGMGEPLLNYDEVVRAIQVLIDPHAANFSTRRITVSTAGIVPRIYELGRDVRTQLAISLNATTDDTRNRIMPINKKWPLQQLLQAMRDYPLPPRRRITVEYVLLRDINDSPEDAKRLVRLLEGIPVKINLLPLNAHDRTEFLPPDPTRVQAFQDALYKRGMNAIRRTPRGQDIDAACGQLGETLIRAS